MKLIEINWQPTTRQLRQFGVLCVIAFPLVGWLWSAAATAMWVLVALGLVAAMLALLWPRALRPVFVGLSLFTAPIGMVLGEVALLVMYFGVIFPLGIWFRLIKRDALGLKRTPGAASYWQTKRRPRSTAQYYRRF